MTHNYTDLTDKQDLAVEKREAIKYTEMAKVQRHQYWDKKYKRFGGCYFVKAMTAIGHVLFVVLLMAIGYLVAFYLLSNKNETSDIIYLSCPDSTVTKLVLPQGLPPTGADLF